MQTRPRSRADLRVEILTEVMSHPGDKMDNPPYLEGYWQAYLASLPPEADRPSAPYPDWGFGDTPQMAGELGRLVLAGVKTATCSLLWEYQAGDEPLPQVGERSIILDEKGYPLCIIETRSVEIVPYQDVLAEFAWAEGEGDRSLDYWRVAHWRFFLRTCQRLGREPTEHMPLVCERFVVIYPRRDTPPAH